VEEAGANRTDLEAKPVGGSRMFDFSGDDGRIGDRNVEAALATLDCAGVDVLAREVDGGHGRSVRFGSTFGRVIST
jgi:chemotaxis receptor (MCP) glutamine deamidase CheD